MPALPDINAVSSTLENMFGISVVVEAGLDSSGLFVDVRPAEVHQNESFSVRTIFGWRSIRAEFRPGAYSADLVRAISQSIKQTRSFDDAVMAVSADGAVVQMSINGFAADPSVREAWPEEWRTMGLSLRRAGVIPDELDTTAETVRWGGRLFGMIVALLPTDDVAEVDEVQGRPEGSLTRVDVNRYERNRANRAACIAIHGTICAACSFSFESLYGPLGRGYIHVHHVLPVSKMGEGCFVDPARDLVPLCPNCHAMVHQQDPPLSILELKRIIAERSESQHRVASGSTGPSEEANVRGASPAQLGRN